MGKELFGALQNHLTQAENVLSSSTKHLKATNIGDNVAVPIDIFLGLIFNFWLKLFEK